MNITFQKGVILELESNIKVAVLDYYAIDAKNIRIIAVAKDFDLYILNFNLDTEECSTEHCYDTVRIAAELRKY